MATKELWFKLENKKRPNKRTVADVNQNLFDLATEICAKQLQKLKDIDPGDLEFYGDYDESEYEDESDESENESYGYRPLRSGIKLEHLITSDAAPLIVRYP